MLYPGCVPIAKQRLTTLFQLRQRILFSFKALFQAVNTGLLAGYFVVQRLLLGCQSGELWQ
ncbi:hypothetical protein VRC02_05220 [Erwinia sp. E_sp_B01_3]|uniref:hypothetical protein n=1 Tax=Erwinia sp. E_sp_B01_3 TaxID=3039402 RepID=UPI0030CBD57B